MKPERETRTWRKKRKFRVLHTNAAILGQIFCGFPYFFVLFLPLRNVSRKEWDQDKRGEVAKQMNGCVWWIPVCKEQYLEGFLSLTAAKATGNMWNKVLMRCNSREEKLEPRQQPCTSHISDSQSPQNTCWKWNQCTFVYSNTFFAWRLVRFVSSVLV